MNEYYQECTRCVMDTTDPEIVFDKDGVCSHCHNFDQVINPIWKSKRNNEKLFLEKIKQIQQEGKGQEYDCIIGLSGGIDSSYLAIILKDTGLRPLVVHVDAGWNSELAVHNIEKIVKYCNWDLHTHVMNWQEIKDLQLAYLKAEVANQDVVQDHAFFAVLYDFAARYNIKNIISGGNFATESIFPKSWHHTAMDADNLKAIHKSFGSKKLKDYKTISMLRYFLYYPYIKRQKVQRLLDFIDYNKAEAVEVLKNTIGFKEYNTKHGESRFTRFFQNYYLPQKFNMDKRRPHLSSIIMSGQLTKEQAQIKLAEPLYDDSELQEDINYIAKKLSISRNELEALVLSPGRSYKDYKNWDRKYQILRKLRQFIIKLTGKTFKLSY